jgi:hypothetical protein
MVNFYTQHRRKSFRGELTDSDADAYIARLTGSYTETELAAINALVVSLKSNNLWTTIDVLYLFCLDNVPDSLLNIKSSSFTATRVNSMSWTARQGFTGNGTNSYLDTNFTPSTAGGNYTQNSATLAIYTPTNSQAAVYGIGGQNSNTANRSYITERWTDGISYNTANAATSGFVNVSVASSNGLTAISRTSSTALAAYRNGSSIGTASVSSVVLSSSSFFIGALNNGGSPIGLSTRLYPLAVIAGGWDATNHLNFSTAVSTILTAFGAS